MVGLARSGSNPNQYDDEDDDVTSISDLSTTCKIVLLNYLAGVGRRVVGVDIWPCCVAKVKGAMLPNLGRLSLRAEPTGEFVRLSRAEARRLNNAGVREPINKSKYMPSDCEPGDEDAFNQLNRVKADEYECFEPFKVWIRDERTGRPGRQYNIYNAQALWDALQYMDKLRDPVTRQPFWREDWWALHEKYDPDGDVPREVRSLPRKDKDEGSDTEEEEPDSDDDIDLDALAALEMAEAAAEARAERPIETWGRFWLKGHVTGEEKHIMETHYFKAHFNNYIHYHGIGAGITVSDISSYRFLVRSGQYATPASQGPLQRQAPLPVTAVDFELLFNRTSKAEEFLGWVNNFIIHTSWDNVAQEMFGIRVLDVGRPYSEFPEMLDDGDTSYSYGEEFRVPEIHRSRYNDVEHWEILNVYNVPFNRHGLHFLPDDANQV
jgi:hypothetical protein